MTQAGLAFSLNLSYKRWISAGSESKEKPIAENAVNVYCTASWMPHMRIALGDASPSVSDYAASFDTPIEPAVDRDKHSEERRSLAVYMLVGRKLPTEYSKTGVLA